MLAVALTRVWLLVQCLTLRRVSRVHLEHFVPSNILFESIIEKPYCGCWLLKVIQLSLSGGVMNPIFSGTRLNVMDKFFLGGPLTFRGFQIKGVGPHEEG